MSCSFPTPLSNLEEKKYVELMEQGDMDARNVLIERNLRLVAHIVKKYVGVPTPQEDLISIGTIGLIKGINTYSSKKATRLATYASKCIENEILMSIRANKKTKQEVSLSLPLGTDKDGNEISFNDILGTDADIIVDYISNKMQISDLYGYIDQVLTSRERFVIIHRYGLKGHDVRTQNQIAKDLGISRSYVSRIEKKALGKLKTAFKSDGVV